MMQNRNRKTSVIITATNIEADTEIQFGNNKDQISIDRSSEGIWKPLFFDVDENSNIHIPDFFKGRIAIFTKEGKLHKEIKTVEGISPRMNYFALNPNNTYTTYDNYTLYLLSQDGTIIWKKEMGLGAIPEKIFTDNRGIFIKFPSTKYLQFLYDSNKKNSEKEDILVNNVTKENNSTLLYQDNIIDIWVTNKRHKSVIINKENTTQITIPVPTNTIEGSGYWVIHGSDTNIYTVLFNESIMLVKCLLKNSITVQS